MLLKICTSYSAGERRNARCIYALSFCLTMPELQQPRVQGIQLPPQRDFTAILDAFDASGCSIPDLIIALLTERRFKSSAYTAELLQQSGNVLRSLLTHAKLPRNAEKVACEALHRVYVREIKDLVKPSAGWNFSAQRATPEDIDDFDLEDLASDVADKAPRLWALLDILLSAKNKPNANPNSNLAMASTTADGETDDDDDDAALQGTIRTPPTSPEQENEKKSNRRLALRKIVRVLLFDLHAIKFPSRRKQLLSVSSCRALVKRQTRFKASSAYSFMLAGRQRKSLKRLLIWG